MMQLGHYLLLLHKRVAKKLQEPTPQQVQRYLEEIDELCNLMKDAPFLWFLVGGMGVDLHVGRITRVHRDFDIEVDVNDSNKAREYMEERGYVLCKKIFTANISREKRLGVYKRTLINMPDPSEMLRLLRLVMERDDFSNYLDITFTRQTPEGTEFGYHGKSFILPFPYTYPGMLYERNGHQIHLRNPVYHAFLKLQGNHLQDQFDLEHLSRVIAPEDLKSIAGLAHQFR